PWKGAADAGTARRAARNRRMGVSSLRSGMDFCADQLETGGGTGEGELPGPGKVQTRNGTALR
ncbi:MAG: hypothetical protein ACI9D0_001425, partial [Bacteroidia bacterium]